VAASLIEMSFGPSRLGQAAVLWDQWNTYGAKGGAALGAERYLVLRYEDLVTDPQPALERVCAFIGLDFVDEMLDHRGSDTHLPAHESSRHASLGRPLTPNIRNWRTTLRAADADLFDAIAGETLDRFGYERAGGVISPATQARAVWERAVFDAARSVKRHGREFKRSRAWRRRP
jgi:Sulfotransferase family